MSPRPANSRGTKKKTKKKVFKHRRQPDRSTTDLSLFLQNETHFKTSEMFLFVFAKPIETTDRLEFYNNSDSS